MQIWLLLAGLAAGLLLDSASFSSPFFPEHSRKFIMLGSAIPLLTGVRLVPPTSRKAGAMITLNPIPASEVTVQITCSHVGRVQPEDDGALTLWFSPSYGRHVAVGNFYGVSAKIEGVLVVYDYRKGLLGYEKTGEASPEEVGRDYHCSISPESSFTLLLTFTSASLSLAYVQKSTEVHCFTMPLSTQQERFMGVSAVSGYPCQRGVEIVALQTNLLLTSERFVERMAASNIELESLLMSIQTEYRVMGTLNVTLGEKDRTEIHTNVRQLEDQLRRVAERVQQWQWKSQLTWEKGQPATVYMQALGESIAALEAQVHILSNVSSTFNLAALAEQHLSSQQEVAGNGQHLSALVVQMQKEVRWYEDAAKAESGVLVVYGGMALVVGLGVYLYWSYARARKRHAI